MSRRTRRPSSCPACGDDVRSATSGRCSECGLILDRSPPRRRATSPGSTAVRSGRIRAFVKTRPWACDHRRPVLTRQRARPASVHAGCESLPVVELRLHRGGPWHFGLRCVSPCMESSPIAVQRTSSGSTSPSGFQQDLFVPWSAGATLSPAMPLCLLGLAAYLTRHSVAPWSALPADTRRSTASAGGIGHRRLGPSFSPGRSRPRIPYAA